MDNIQILKKKNNQLINWINNFKCRDNLREKDKIKKEKLKNDLENNIKNKQEYNYLIEKNKELEKQIKEKKN